MSADRDLLRRLGELTPDKRYQLQQMLSKSRPDELRRREPAERVPLAYGQERLLILEQISPGNPAYNETNSLRFQFSLDSEVLRKAIDEIVRRHEVLRTHFQIIDGEPFQEVAASASPVSLPVVDLRHLPPAEREPAALRSAVEQSGKPFDIVHGPLFRCAVYRLDVNDYLFALTMHHLICDGWSMGVFMVELVTLYWSFSGGKPSPFSELLVQYGDYAVWQRRALAESSRNSQLRYWKSQLKDLPLLDLPSDRPRPPEFTFRGARVPVLIDAESFRAMTALAAQENMTLFMLLLAAFAALLHRYTAQEDLPIGTPSGGRVHLSLEPLIGFFVNTVVMRIAASGDSTFLELLREVRDTATEAFANQSVPFEKLIDELQPQRDKSRNPLFQVSFQLFSKPSSAGLSKETLIPFTPVDCGISKFDLSMSLIAEETRIQGHIEYSTDLFDAARIHRMREHFGELLRSALADPTVRVSQLQLMAAGERQQLLDWGQNVAPYPRDETLPRIFLNQVRSRPHSIAVRFEDRTLTYAELAQRAEIVAEELAAAGVKEGDCVLVLMDRGLDFMPAILGILLLRAAYVPLDPGYPEERVAHVIQDSGARSAIVCNGSPEWLQRHLSAILVSDNLGTERRGRALPPIEQGRAEDIAYLMYTSGTTGLPKGVAVTHRNILRLVLGIHYADLDSDQKLLQLAPVSFDASTFEIWGALLNGATVEIFPPGVPLAEDLGAFIKERAITLAFMTTALFRQMVERNSSDLRAVKQLITGGEEMMVDDARTAWARLPHTRLFNAYGPTECTTFSTMYPLGRPDTLAARVPIGRPTENTDTYICDRHGVLMPIGIPGELCIGGDGVAAGYWRSAELTAEKFVPNPFRPNERMYRTGDMACFSEDGQLLFLGRRDRQVKISGFRIEIGEVEAAIARHPAVRAVAVLATGSPEKRLEAYCEVREGGVITLAGVREFLAKSLPLYMMPSRVVSVDRLPLTPNGKVDAVALSKTGCAIPRDPIPPRTDVQKSIAAMWSEMLSVENPSIGDDFFELGGQSLIATRLLSRIRATFEKAITMREFFDDPTIGGLARKISDGVPEVMNAAGAE